MVAYESWTTAVMQAPQVAKVAGSRLPSGATATLLGSSRAMATITYGPPSAVIGKPAPTFSAVSTTTSTATTTNNNTSTNHRSHLAGFFRFPPKMNKCIRLR